MTKFEPPSRPWNPVAGTLRPFDQYGISLGKQSFPIEVPCFIRRLEPETIQMEHRASGPLIAMHQRIRRTGCWCGNAKSAGNGLDEGRLACSELTLECHQLSGFERAPERFAMGIERLLRQEKTHA